MEIIFVRILFTGIFTFLLGTLVMGLSVNETKHKTLLETMGAAIIAIALLACSISIFGIIRIANTL